MYQDSLIQTSRFWVTEDQRRSLHLSGYNWYAWSSFTSNATAFAVHKHGYEINKKYSRIFSKLVKQY